MKDAELDKSINYCRDIAKTQARNFYYGMKLTPEPRRSALYALYAWMRAADDLADDESHGALPEDRIRRIELFRDQTQEMILEGAEGLPEAVLQKSESGGDVDHQLMWPAVRHSFQKYRMPRSFLDGLIDGQIMDQFKKRYQTFEELHDYCFKVASLVGMCCIQIWGLKPDGDIPNVDSEAMPQNVRELAIKRGLALQLTNVIRDIVEDAQRDRIYIPIEELQQCGFSPEQFLLCIRSGQCSFAMKQLLKQQVQRARRYYNESASLEKHVSQDCRATCWSIMRIYRGLLDKIEKKPERVLGERVRLSSIEKVRIGLVAMGRF